MSEGFGVSITGQPPEGERSTQPKTKADYGTYKAKPMSDFSTDKKSADAFKTIGEVAELLDVQQHVLRFWETKFSQIKPLKRGGGRRYYRPDDIELLQAIHTLLYKDGYTIKGVQKIFKNNGKKALLAQAMESTAPANQGANVPSVSAPLSVQKQAPLENSAPQSASVKTGIAGLSHDQRQILRDVLNDLKAMRDLLG